jgi:mono/diheme cytochrome c family protein
MTICAKTRAVAVPMVLAALAAGLGALAQDAATFFQQNCAACHTIGGGRRVGPDLKGVTSRRDRSWLVTFINDPQGVLASGDPYAIQLKQQMGGALMIKVPGISPELAGRLLDYIDGQSGAPTPASAPPPPAVAVKAVPAPGLFTGAEALSGGGPPCISCHSVTGLPGFGGGALGPDLTQASSRLGGAAGLAAWLASPPTPTMRAVFGARRLTPSEIASLVSYLQDESALPANSASPVKGAVLFAGAGGAAGCLLLFGLAWRRRLKSVRAPLVEASRKGAPHG